MNMNRTAFYKFLFLASILLGSEPLAAVLLKPAEGGEEREILMVSGKRRLYYTIRPEGLTYAVNGPVRLKFITRYPAVKRNKKRHSFRYAIVIDDTDSVTVRHRYKRQKGIRSIQHPNHNYTYAGHYTINIPAGQHWIRVSTPGDLKYPVLMRAVTKSFEAPKGNKREITPMVHQSSKLVMIGDNDIEYFELKNTVPLQVALKGPVTLRVVSRLAFENWMGDEESFRLQIREEDDVIGTYFFNTERSDKSTISDQSEVVPGKWRTCEVKLSAGEHVITVKLLERDRSVLLRFLEYR